MKKLSYGTRRKGSNYWKHGMQGRYARNRWANGSKYYDKGRSMKRKRYYPKNIF